MHNLQLIDSEDGGFFGFDRNDYPIDQGIYTELYCALFSTTTQWWGDKSFGINTFNITSKTGVSLKNNNSTSQSNINLIKKAIKDDLDRFTGKNKNIEVSAIEVAYWSKTILIIIELIGYNKPFNFIYQKTKESLENSNFKIY